MMNHENETEGRNMESGLQKVIPYLPAVLREAVQKISPAQTVRIQELRLRLGRCMHAVIGGNELAVQPDGSLSPESGEGIIVTRQMLDTLFQNACMHSVHSCQNAIRNGFLTVAGGNRIGLCGTAVVSGHVTETVRAVSSMNIRIASARTGCAESLAEKLMLRSQREGVLIAGAPASGKTTILRDLARILGKTSRVSLLDERGELAASQNGIPQFDIGVQTDVFDGYPKAYGIETAARVMSPEWIICDELGSDDEAAAMIQASLCGVGMIASVHSGTLEELYDKPAVSALIRAGVFKKAVLLGTGSQCGQALQIRTLRRNTG